MNQALLILKELRKGRQLSKLDCIKKPISSTCGDKRISELRAAGHQINDYWVKRSGKKFKRYYLESL